MFCNKCGSEVAEGMQFCTKCGNPMGQRVDMEATASEVQPVNSQDNVVPASAPAGTGYDGYYTPPKKNSAKPLIIAIAAVVVVAVVIWAVFFKSSPKAPVKQAAESIKKQEWAQIVETLPIDHFEIDTSELGFDLEDIEYKIGDVEKLDDDEIEELEKYYDMLEDESDGVVKFVGEIQDAARVEFEAELDGDEEEAEIVVIKIKGKWYLDIISTAAEMQGGF